MKDKSNDIIKQVAISISLLVLSYFIGFGEFDLIKGIKLVVSYLFCVLLIKFIIHRMYSRFKMVESDEYVKLNFPLYKFRKEGFKGVRLLFNTVFTIAIVIFSIALLFILIDSFLDWSFDRVNTIFLMVIIINGLLYFKPQFVNFLDKLIKELE